MEKLHIGDHKY